MDIASQTYDARTVETALRMKPSTLRHYADRTGASPHGRAGRTRRFTLGDVCTVLAAEMLVALRGYSTAVAVEFARAMAPEFPRLAADEAAKAYLLAWPNKGRPGYRVEIVHDAATGGQRAFENDDELPIIIAVRPYLEDALIIMRDVRAAMEAARDA